MTTTGAKKPHNDGGARHSDKKDKVASLLAMTMSWSVIACMGRCEPAGGGRGNLY